MNPQLLHDLEHELATILLLVETARGDPALGDETRHRLQLIELEVEYVQTLVGTAAAEDAAEDAAADPGEAVDTVDVRDVLAGVVEPRRRTLATDLVLEAPRPAPARVVPTALRRLVANLVDNAVRAAGPGGRVEVTVDAGPPVVVRVVDDGPGWGSGSGGGRGLGLGIVDALAGTLGVTVRIAPGVGSGTVAEVTLPPERPLRVASVPMPREGAAR